MDAACKKCGAKRPESDFWSNGNGNRRNVCKFCEAEKRKGKYVPPTDPAVIERRRANGKRYYDLRRKGNAEYQNRHGEYFDEWYAANRDTVTANRRAKANYRADGLLRNYGMTEEDYEVMNYVQDGLCKICLKPPVGEGTLSRLHVDHNHNTGMVRGLLCSQCNTALGLANEDSDRLRSMASYLERFASPN